MRPGIDLFLETPPHLGSACALICAASSVSGQGHPVFRLIHKQIGQRLKAIWSLQHGFCNDKQDNMILSQNFLHKDLQIPVLSLYGEQLQPQVEWLTGIDTLIVDIQDIGTRVYTFTNHLVKVARSLSGKTIRWILLDRPNPLGGIDLEGPILSLSHRSIVGEISVPMRHALSPGEYLRLAIKEEKLDIDLTVIPAQGWKRVDHHKGIWTLPSPNMPSPLTAHIYPGAVLLEGTNLSEGRGTTRPFELIGAPFIDAVLLAEHMNSLSGLAITAIPMHFKPEYSKFKDELCNGILCYQPNPDLSRSFAFIYELIRWTRHRYPALFTWKRPPYEFEYHRLPIDMICGGDSFRSAIEQNIPLVDWLKQSEAGFHQYRQRISEHLLYD